MGFSPESMKEIVPESSMDRTMEAMGFSIDKVNVNKKRSKDPQKAEKQAADARKKMLKTLNALKIVNPLLLAVTEKYFEGTEDNAVDLFKQLVGQASEMSEFTMKSLEINPEEEGHLWIRNNLERVFCEMMKDQIQRGKPASLNLMKPFVLRLSDIKPEEPSKQPFEKWATETAVKMAIVKAMSPVLMKASGFDFFRKNLEKDLEDISKLLLEVAGHATLVMMDPLAGDAEKISLFSVLIQEAGLQYANAWQVCGKKVVNDLSRLKDKELKELLDNAEGLPLTSVNQLFEKNFKRLINLSSKLVPSSTKKGAL